MSKRRIAVVQAGLLCVAFLANAAVRNNNIRIQVLDSETHSVAFDEAGAPRNCESVNFDAYCHNSKTMQLTNTLLVQEDNESPYRVTCTVDTKWSSCAPLPKGRSFEARRNKRGLVVYYADDKGKVRKQLYAIVVSEEGKPGTAAPVSAAPGPSSVAGEQQAPVPTTSTSQPDESVKCSFSSTPSGAEVSVDGRYVGSTPSVLNLSVGNHAVEVTLPGFAQWKRDLTVSTGSQLTVNAVLQKVQ